MAKRRRGIDDGLFVGRKPSASNGGFELFHKLGRQPWVSRQERICCRRWARSDYFLGMSPTQKKKQRRGRPPIANSPKLRKADGERLAAVLNRLGLSQAEAGRRSGVRQGAIAGIISGTRALGREDLRRLSQKLNISADYLLGVSGTTMLVNEARTNQVADALEEVVTANVLRELEIPASDYFKLQSINGDHLVAKITEKVISEMRNELESERERAEVYRIFIELIQSKAVMDESVPKELWDIVLKRQFRAHAASDDREFLSARGLTAEEEEALGWYEPGFPLEATRSIRRSESPPNPKWDDALQAYRLPEPKSADARQVASKEKGP